MTVPNPFLLLAPDLRCTDDLDLFANECTTDFEVLVQDVFHILVEDLGSNPDDPDRGIGIDTFLSGDSATLAKLPSIIDRQLIKDNRITSSHTDAPEQRADGSWLITITIEALGTIIPLKFATSPITGALQIGP